MINKHFFFGDTFTAFENKTDNELRKMNLLFTFIGVPELTKIGTFLIKTLLKLNFPIKKIIKATLFKQFCGGETLEECQDSINQLYKAGIKSIPDYSVEGESDEKNFINNTKIIVQTITSAATNHSIGFAVFKITGIGSASLLEKAQENMAALNEKELMAMERIQYRIHSLCEAAFSANIPLLIDAEESWIQQIIDKLALQMMQKFNKHKPIIYNTYQMYKTDSFANLTYLLDLSRKEFFFPAAKLVRGAYMEKERSRAEARQTISPIHATKEKTDDAYNDALSYCIQNKIALCAGTHNEESNFLLTQLMEKNHYSPNTDKVYFAQLYGMSDHISFNLVKKGYNVTKYIPFGPVQSVMPYLFRRAEENVSVTKQMGRELELIREELKRRKNS